jgi:hypothetical protein
MLEITISNLAILYVIIFCNFFAQLIGCDLQRMMTNSMYAKHAIAIISVFFLVTLLNKDQKMTISSAWYYTIMLYGLYFLSTRMKIYYAIPLLLTLLLHENIKLYTDRLEQGDPKYQRCKKVLRVIQVVAISIIVMGVAHYFIRQLNDFGPKFNMLTFFIGKTECNQ